MSPIRQKGYILYGLFRKRKTLANAVFTRVCGGERGIRTLDELLTHTRVPEAYMFLNVFYSCQEYFILINQFYLIFVMHYILFYVSVFYFFSLRRRKSPEGVDFFIAMWYNYTIMNIQGVDFYAKDYTY